MFKVYKYLDIENQNVQFKWFTFSAYKSQDELCFSTKAENE